MAVTVLKFEAEWCGPCQRMKPIFDNVKSAVEDVEFRVIDIDAEPELAALYNIMSIPTLVFLKDGNEINRMVGMSKEKDIIDAIEALK